MVPGECGFGNIALKVGFGDRVVRTVDAALKQGKERFGSAG